MLQEFLDFLDSAEFRPLDEQFLRELGPMIMEIIRNPSSNPLAAMILLLIVVVFLIIVVLAAVLFVSRMSDDDEEYEYVVVTDGEAVAVPASAAPRPRPVPVKDPVRYHKGLLWGVAAAVALMVATGVSSQSRTVCMSCHEGIAHTDEGVPDAHASVSCTRCHESGGMLSSYTLGVPMRAVHVITGLYEEEPGRGYGVVTGKACSSCHSGVADGVIEVPSRALLMSHAEPLEAGAVCLDCHGLNEDSKLGRATAGMSECLRCHDDESASAECSTCHTGDVSLAALTTGTHEPRQLVGQPNCYTCHDPAPCDSCHGVRLPHPPQYRFGHMMDAARDIWFNSGRTCQSECHTAERNSCYQLGCHAYELDFHRGEDPSFPRNHTDPEWSCEGCHEYAGRLDDPCQMCH